MKSLYSRTIYDRSPPGHLFCEVYRSMSLIETVLGLYHDYIYSPLYSSILMQSSCWQCLASVFSTLSTFDIVVVIFFIIILLMDILFSFQSSSIRHFYTFIRHDNPY